MNASRHPKEVLLLTSTNNAYSRGVTQGVGDFAAAHGQWNVTPMLLHGAPPVFEEFDGVISVTSMWRDELVASRVVGVLTSSASVDPRLASVVNDNRAVGVLAADHLMARELPYYVGVGPTNIALASHRLEGFEERLRATGRQSVRHDEGIGVHHSGTWQMKFDLVQPWLEALPKPVGLFAVTDELAHGLLRACRHLHLRVPDDVAVVGVNNDEILAALSHPPLSSVIPDARGIGRRAAEVLDALLKGGPSPPESIVIPPLGVESRQSTDILAIDDPDASSAYRYIHRHADSPLSVENICRELAVSRRSLERKFSRAFGRTILDEIRLARVKKAQHLLAVTDEPLPRVSERCGFRHTANFFAAFRRVTGTTPAVWRKQRVSDSSR